MRGAARNAIRSMRHVCMSPRVITGGHRPLLMSARGRHDSCARSASFGWQLRSDLRLAAAIRSHHPRTLCVRARRVYWLPQRRAVAGSSRMSRTTSGFVTMAQKWLLRQGASSVQPTGWVAVKRHPWPVRYARCKGSPGWCGSERQYGKGPLGIPARGRIRVELRTPAGQARPAAGRVPESAARYHPAFHADDFAYTAAADAH